MNIPQTGPNQSKSNFFKEISAAFEFLEVYYRLTAEQQNELQIIMIRMENETCLKPKG